MTDLTTKLLREIDEAQQRSMQALLEGWQREIEAHEKALVEARKKAAEQQAEDAALASSVAAYLQGLVSQARSGDDVVTSIPTGFRVASESISTAAISALVSEVTAADDPVAAQAQRSAAWAINNGFVPHPGDLATLMRSAGVDEDWSQRLHQNGVALDNLDTHFKNPQLNVHVAVQRLELVKDTVRLLDAYTPDRTLRLVSNPQAVLELPGKIGSSALSASVSGRGGNPKMGHGPFNRMLDSLFV